MRRLLKFLHVMAAFGLMGAMASLIVLSSVSPPKSALPAYAATRAAMSAISTWIFLPSLGLSLIAGLTAIAINRAYQNAGWAWVKLITGLSLFEGGLQGVQGPMSTEAEQSAAVLAGHADAATLSLSLAAERSTLWVLLAVATANVALGIWRPKLSRIPD